MVPGYLRGRDVDARVVRNPLWYGPVPVGDDYRDRLERPIAIRGRRAGRARVQGRPGSVTVAPVVCAIEAEVAKAQMGRVSVETALKGLEPKLNSILARTYARFGK